MSQGAFTEVPPNPGSVYADGVREALRHKWIESERARRDLGELAIRQWVRDHWHEYLRARWYEHIQGKKFWTELDRGDFGLLQRRFAPHQMLLVDRILDRLNEGQENLGVLQWAFDWQMPMEEVLEILEVLDINRCRLAHDFFDDL